MSEPKKTDTRNETEPETLSDEEAEEIVGGNGDDDSGYGAFGAGRSPATWDSPWNL